MSSECFWSHVVTDIDDTRTCRSMDSLFRQSQQGTGEKTGTKRQKQGERSEDYELTEKAKTPEICT